MRCLAGGPPSALRIHICISCHSPPCNRIYSAGTAMAGSGVNFAITKDGGAYNKLQRPQDYLMTATALPPPKNATHGGAPSQTSTSKRKHENADNTLKHKRSRPKREEAENVDSRPGTANKSSRRTKFGIQVELPGLDGDCSSDDDIGEALAYLRSVRYVTGILFRTKTVAYSRQSGQRRQLCPLCWWPVLLTMKAQARAVNAPCSETARG
jgi:hypothetical protein